MIKTFDCYVLSRFLHTFAILFVSTFGLYVVIDGFTNVDGFMEASQSSLSLLLTMLGYYLYKSSWFFDIAGSILSAVAVIIVFTLLERNKEVHPLLAAGIPAYRIALPVGLGVAVVTVLLTLNQELVIPRISDRLQSSRGEPDGERESVEPVYDYSTRICILGRALHLGKRRMDQARFVLPVPEVVQEPATLQAREATYVAESPAGPSGWLLRNVTPRYEELRLTPKGRELVRPTPHPGQLFVVTDVSFDQLSNRSRSNKLVSTPELIRRIRNPAYGIVSVRGQLLNLHRRLTRPLLDFIAIFVVMPLVMRRESRSLVGNVAGCIGLLGLTYVLAQVSYHLGGINRIPVDFATWIPVILLGIIGGWNATLLRT